MIYVHSFTSGDMRENGPRAVEFVANNGEERRDG